MDTQKLKDKLAQICQNQNEIEEAKKDSALAYNRDLRRLKKQNATICEALGTGEIDELIESKHFTHSEKQDLLGPDYNKGTLFDEGSNG